MNKIPKFKEEIFMQYSSNGEEVLSGGVIKDSYDEEHKISLAKAAAIHFHKNKEKDDFVYLDKLKEIEGTKMFLEEFASVTEKDLYFEIKFK